MSRGVVIVVLCTFVFALIQQTAMGQNNVTSRLKVLRGANLNLIFNSYNKFKNGIEYRNYTQLQIYFSDTINGGTANPTTSGWQLTMRALQPNIEGDMTVYALPLNSIVMDVTLEGTGSTATYPLSSTEQVVAQGNDAILSTCVSIGYKCGTMSSNNMLNKVPDNYVVDLEFTLKPR